jgi:hypothetical protein
MPASFTCAHCGTPKSVRGVRPHRYCSQRCYFDARRVTPDTFWALVEKTDACWPWRGRRYKGGYGLFCARPLLGYSVYNAHRVAYILTFGPIPRNRDVCHTCDTPACCRPDHLFLGSNADNVADKMRKRRHRGPRGERNPFTKLTGEAVRAIWCAVHAGVSIQTLTAQHGVGLQAIRNIVNGYTWSHVTGLTPTRRYARKVVAK